jgi:hypothetical protein
VQEAKDLSNMGNEELKNEMLVLFNRIDQELEDFVSGLAPDEKAERGSIKKWSAKDTLAHLAFWGAHFNQQVENALAGEKVPNAGDYYDLVNNGVLYDHLDQPFEDAFREEVEVYQRSLQILEEIPADDLLDPDKYAFLDGRSLLDRALGTEGWHITHHISDYYAKHGQIDRAIQIQETYSEALQKFPSWRANAVYNQACFYALNGMKDQAIEKLSFAFEQRTDLIEWSEQDPDLASIREDPEYLAIVAEHQNKK